MAPHLPSTQGGASRFLSGLTGAVLIRAGFTRGAVARRDAAAADATAATAIVTTSNTAADSSTDASANSSSNAASDSSADSSADSSSNSTSNSAANSASDTTAFFLRLVSNEVNFRFAGLRGRGRGYRDFRRVFRFLDQNIDQSFLFVLWLNRNYWRGWRWWAWCLDEDDFVVFLSLRDRDRTLRSEFFRFWWWHVDVDVLLYGGAASETAAESSAESGSASKSAAGSASETASASASKTASSTKAASASVAASYSSSKSAAAKAASSETAATAGRRSAIARRWRTVIVSRGRFSARERHQSRQDQVYFSYKKRSKFQNAPVLENWSKCKSCSLKIFLKI